MDLLARFSHLTPEQQQQAMKAFGGKSKKKKSPANELTSSIIKYIFAIGGAARRINTQGQYDVETGKWRPSGMKRGTEDITATIPITVAGKKIGLHVAIEVKIGRDSQSDEQQEREREIKKAGGVYIIAKNFDQIRADIDQIRSYYT